MRRLTVLAVVLTLMTAVVLVGCVPGTADEVDDADTLAAEVEELEEEKQQLLEQIDRHRAKIKDLAQDAWMYKLSVDGQCIPEDGHLQVSEGDFDVVLSERLPLHYDKYTETLEEGRIKSAAEHVTLLSDDKLYKETAGAGTVVDVPIAFLFRDLPEGSVVQLTISAELQKRLQIETRDIEIVVGE